MYYKKKSERKKYLNKEYMKRGNVQLNRKKIEVMHNLNDIKNMT